MIGRREEEGRKDENGRGEIGRGENEEGGRGKENKEDERREESGRKLGEFYRLEGMLEGDINMAGILAGVGEKCWCALVGWLVGSCGDSRQGQ